MTRATELRCLQERAHHRPAMRGNIIENLLVGDTGEQTRPVLSHQQRGFAHHVSTDPMSVCRLNRMTGDARNAVIVERPFDMRVLRHRTTEQRCRVMTRLAMASEFNSLLSL